MSSQLNGYNKPLLRASQGFDSLRGRHFLSISKQLSGLVALQTLFASLHKVFAKHFLLRKNPPKGQLGVRFPQGTPFFYLFQNSCRGLLRIKLYLLHCIKFLLNNSYLIRILLIFVILTYQSLFIKNLQSIKPQIFLLLNYIYLLY